MSSSELGGLMGAGLTGTGLTATGAGLAGRTGLTDWLAPVTADETV